MLPQRGTAGATGDQRERGSSVTRHSDWNIRDRAHRATERTPALSRPRGSGPERGSELMARLAQERGPDDARREEGAAKRNQETQADKRKVARGARTRKRRTSTRRAAAWEESTVRSGVEEREEQRCTKSTAHVGRANHGREGGRQVWGAGSRGKRQQRPGLGHDAIPAERCPTSLCPSQASRQQRRPRRRRGQ